VVNWTEGSDLIDEATTMALKTVPNTLNRGPKLLKQGRCYVCFGLNGGFFCRNSFSATQLPLCGAARINKLCERKELWLIVRGGSELCFPKYLSGLQMRGIDFLAQNRLRITNYNKRPFAVTRRHEMTPCLPST
jgi:hypothetical protein